MDPSKPSIAVIMGSDSDLPVMAQAAQAIEEFGVNCEVTIVSAHRTPDRMVEYARTAQRRGLKVIIAGAGGAAHLPGMVAACTALPVIGVPILSSNSLDGWDSILSILQMPAGIPVATVALNQARNAGLLALRILGAHEPAILTKMESFLDKQRDDVIARAGRLESQGFQQYLKMQNS